MKIEGKNPVRELLESDMTIEKIMVADKTSDVDVRLLVKSARERGVKVEFVDKRLLDKVSVTGHHQGIIAEASEFKYADLDEVVDGARAAGKEILLVILDEISDPHNLGSIIRVAECAGATAVVIPSRHSACVNETVIRTSAGATAYMPVVKVTNINQTIENLKEKNIWIYGCDMEGDLMYDANLKGDIAIVIGSEGEGIKPLTFKLCDDIISIPMSGKINSLNASVSAGIVIYEAIRQRRK